MKTVTFRGGGTYREFQAAVSAAWPTLRAFLFVDDHVYWKEGGGELAPDDVVGQAGQEVTLHGHFRESDACDAVRAAFGLVLELRRVQGGLRLLDRAEPLQV